MWGITKYFAELDFQQRCQAGQLPMEAWAAVRRSVEELIHPNGYSLTYFAPELHALRNRLIPAEPLENGPCTTGGETASQDRQFWLDLTRELQVRVDLLWEGSPAEIQACA